MHLVVPLLRLTGRQVHHWYTPERDTQGGMYTTVTHLRGTP